jgi:hypothetical protein
MFTTIVPDARRLQSTITAGESAAWSCAEKSERVSIDIVSPAGNTAEKAPE